MRSRRRFAKITGFLYNFATAHADVFHFRHIPVACVEILELSERVILLLYPGSLWRIFVQATKRYDRCATDHHNDLPGVGTDPRSGEQSKIRHTGKKDKAGCPCDPLNHPYKDHRARSLYPISFHPSPPVFPLFHRESLSALPVLFMPWRTPPAPAII